jgi:hypothetical protein
MSNENGVSFFHYDEFGGSKKKFFNSLLKEILNGNYINKKIEPKPPVIINILEQRGGLSFNILGEIHWGSKSDDEGKKEEIEWLATVYLSFSDVSGSLKKYQQALLEERGVFLRYPGPTSGLQNNIRVVNIEHILVEYDDILYADALRLSVVLTRADINNIFGEDLEFSI